MAEEKTYWKKNSNQLYSWAECTQCGYKVIGNIWGELELPSVCPGCNKLALIPKPKEEFKLSSLPLKGRCTASSCGNWRTDRDACILCGWNSTEKQRRLHLPWSVNEKGLLYKNVHITMEERLKEANIL